jgi:GNAT superfamily N-acetyltransferase
MEQAVIRPAGVPDIEQIIVMRREFTFEGEEGEERSGYEQEFRAFLADAIEGGRWQIWVAEVGGRIAAHVFVALVDKVPRPTRKRRRIAYLTNVYTRPEFRGKGIGGRLLDRAQAAARREDVELMLVWPSDESVDFYRRLGFESPVDLLVWEA